MHSGVYGNKPGGHGVHGFSASGLLRVQDLPAGVRPRARPGHFLSDSSRTSCFRERKSSARRCGMTTCPSGKVLPGPHELEPHLCSETGGFLSLSKLVFAGALVLQLSAYGYLYAERRTPQQQVSEPGSGNSGSKSVHYGAQNSRVDIPAQTGAWALKHPSLPVCRAWALSLTAAGVFAV